MTVRESSHKFEVFFRFFPLEEITGRYVFGLTIVRFFEHEPFHPEQKHY